MTDQSVADLYAGAPPSPQQGAQTLDELRDLLAKARNPETPLADSLQAANDLLDALPSLLDRLETAEAVSEAFDWIGTEWTAERVEALTDKLSAAEARADALAESLRLILPLARGYAAAHRVGSNAACVERAETTLGARDDS